MGRIISVHEYDLKAGVEPEQFERALRTAEARGLLQLPGLLAHHFVKGTKGVRNGAYAAVWIYESREAWERLWGSPEHTQRPEDHPDTWKVWEEELLAPFLEQHPDAIRFTAYEELGGVTGDEAATVLEDALSTTYPDDAHSEDEARFVTIRASNRCRILVVAHTERNDTIRIISARRATRREREFYEQGKTTRR